MWVDSITHHHQSSKLGLKVYKGFLQWLLYLPLLRGLGRKISLRFAPEEGKTEVINSFVRWDNH